MTEFSKGSESPLTFPLTQKTLNEMPECQLASPRVGRAHGFKNEIEGNEEELLFEVLKTRAMVSRDEFPWEYFFQYYPVGWEGEFSFEMPAPLANEGLSFHDPRGLAHVVHMDSPNQMPVAVMQWLLNNGYKPKQANGDVIDFLEYVPETEMKLSQAVNRNLTKAFEIKWYFGQARPEELVGYNCTEYANGCPTHPSFPAGHGAAASAVSVLVSRFNLDAYALKQVRDSAYIWAMSRTLAGVHFYPDNIAGLRVGGLL